MEEEKSSPSTGFNALPMTPVSETESGSDPSAPDTTFDSENPAPDRKLKIRVPIEYAPPTPPPSASLPAIPPRRQSLTPVASAGAPTKVARRVSASAVQALKGPHTSEFASSNLSPSAADGEAKMTKTLLMTGSHSAIYLPIAVEGQLDASEKPEKYGSQLIPSLTTKPIVSRPRRKSAPGQRDSNTTLELPLPRVRKSPSILHAPAHVSQIDFDSSSSDEDEEEYEPRPVSTPDEGDAPADPYVRGASEESDLSRWAPEPAYFPHQSSISTPRTQRSTRTSTSASPRKERDGSTRRRPVTPQHHALFGMTPEVVQRDVGFTVQALMSPEMFANMLSDPRARQRFREFLAVDSSTAELDFWTDARFLGESMRQFRASSVAFRDLYVSSSGDAHVPLAPEVRRELLGVLQHVIGADLSFNNIQAHLLESIFQRYVKHKIIQEMHVTLGKANLLSQDSEGLGDTFVLTNPRLPDHPVVLVSDGFVDMTGYPKAQIIGRNCRFLQGPGTLPASVQRIRDGLNSGQGCTELLLNYRRNGDPFYCLLCIIPIRDTLGTIVYFIGGQTNVTSLLASDKDLRLHSTSDGPPQPIQMSPALAPLREQNPGVKRPTTADSSLSPGPGLAADSSAVYSGAEGRGGTMKTDGKQVIAGAEAMMNIPGAPGLQDQYSMFQNTYNKILIFKFKKREITFVSPQMLAFLGLSTRTQRDLNASPLIRQDIVRLLVAGEDHNETRILREELKGNILRGTPCSLYCALKIPGKRLLTRTDSSRNKFAMMHMTPIKDSDNVAVAFVAIFG
ncbi:hypothetical protein MSAN_00453600 [Mycena sanguinolenta]|uniref:LOV domain-containing protein n=1 Tax=Mycena sanguinolenta TaxID=230812 RepID=A0A8H6ZAS2_9AGAR|nr:hypothetical protein MSAN_00453600 [Mycena sanguinolenta]